MDRRQALELLVSGGIGTLMVPEPTVQILYAAGQDTAAQSSSQDEHETPQQLVRRVAANVLNGTPIKPEYLDPEFPQYIIGKDEVAIVDPKTGVDMTDKLRYIKGSDFRFRAMELEEIFNGLVVRFRRGCTDVEGRGFNMISEAKVYFGNGQELNWDNPNNYLNLSWRDIINPRWSHFVDMGIKGRADDCSHPLLSAKARILGVPIIGGDGDCSAFNQADYIRILRRINQLYQKP